MYKINAGWYIIILGSLTLVIMPLLVLKIKKSYGGYKKMLREECLQAERCYNELVAKEAVIYEAQLRYNERLALISSLYEITKDMSVGLRFADIFRVLAEYLQKNFLFKKVSLILLKEEEKPSSGTKVYEAEGLEDTVLRAKGIIPKLEVKSRPFDEHDKKIYGLLQGDIRRIQIVRTEWRENPYMQYLPEGAQTYIAVPVIIDNQLIGILTIEDLSAGDFEKFSILAAQFALEMRRIVLYERVEEMAITDGLTKAFAKRHIMERLSEEFERSMRHNFNLSFLMVDIDHFKNYNDTYGHLVGDAVLKEIVALLKANTREVDLVGRFGGEEFCVILPETKKDEARLVAERIRNIIERHKFKAYDEATDVTISIGIATYPYNAKDINALVENSDKALYMAKNSGRNRVVAYI